MTWAQIGEALGVAELARAAGQQPGRGGMGVGGGAVGVPDGRARRVPVDLPGLRRGRQRPRAERGSPAEDEPEYAEDCQRIAAAVAGWLAQGD